MCRRNAASTTRDAVTHRTTTQRRNDATTQRRNDATTQRRNDATTQRRNDATSDKLHQLSGTLGTQRDSTHCHTGGSNAATYSEAARWAVRKPRSGTTTQKRDRRPWRGRFSSGSTKMLQRGSVTARRRHSEAASQRGAIPSSTILSPRRTTTRHSSGLREVNAMEEASARNHPRTQRTTVTGLHTTRRKLSQCATGCPGTRWLVVTAAAGQLHEPSTMDQCSDPSRQ
jgi:hypothetical protein